MHANEPWVDDRLHVRRRHHRAAAGPGSHPAARRSAAHRRGSALGREHAVLATANTQLELAKARADDKTTRLEATLAGMTDGVAMVDGVCDWSNGTRYSPDCGVPARILRVGLPMEDIVRAQAAAGEFGNVDIEAEVARRMAVLRAGRYDGTRNVRGPMAGWWSCGATGCPTAASSPSTPTSRRASRAENALREANAMAESATQGDVALRRHRLARDPHAAERAAEQPQPAGG